VTDRGDDKTRVTAQPALTVSSGREWVVLGGVLAAVSLGVLIPLSGLHLDVALIGACLVLALYIALIVVRLAVPRRQRRVYTMASLFGGMAIVALICTAIAAAQAWGPIS
jgi:Flp pilus assembly protein TadB